MAKESKFKKGDTVKLLVKNPEGNIFEVYEILRNEVVIGYDYQDESGNVCMKWKVKKSLLEVIE